MNTMGIEIERKYTVISTEWRGNGDFVHAVQGYLAVGPPVSVRVRIMGDNARLNIKESTLDIERSEFEYPIPVQDARTLLNGPLVGNVVEKYRHFIQVDGHLWEVDEFLGANQGLVVAEIELSHRDEKFTKPSWTGVEVSGDARYLNSSLAQCPYAQWDR